jgi:two-component system, OmpR family, sensor histidine kinase BaeS
MTLVKKTFMVFLVAFLIQIALMVVLIVVGYERSEYRWQTVRYSQAEKVATAVLSGTVDSSEILDFPGQIAIYDAENILLATNRGTGVRAGMARNLSLADRFPVTNNGRIIGYFATGEVSFGQDSANLALLNSMGIVLIAGIVVSLAISLLAALYFAKVVSRPADKLSIALQNMTGGNLSQEVVGVGTEEIMKIARSVESLRVRLLSERTIRAQWAQDLAHDLRTPVASIKAQLEGMSDGILAATPQRFIRTNRELMRMESLINDLEELMRLESPEVSLIVEPVDAHWFAEASRERFEPLIVQKNITFKTNVKKKTFNADEGLLSRAVSNVLSNAVRHCNEGGSVTLDIDDTGGQTCISIHNTGIPIPEDEIPKVFERLYRGEYARNSPGSGLGLTIAERIVRLHQGTIEIESGDTIGTKFTFRLPSELNKGQLKQSQPS